MNERIESIAVETLSFLRHNVLSRSDMEEISIPDVFVEKFAELIVNECMELIYDESEKVFGEWRCKDGQHVWWKVKEHFGIE